MEGASALIWIRPTKEHYDEKFWYRLILVVVLACPLAAYGKVGEAVVERAGPAVQAQVRVQEPQAQAVREPELARERLALAEARPTTI